LNLKLSYRCPNEAAKQHLMQTLESLYVKEYFDEALPIVLLLEVYLLTSLP
jgi:hypothetical protein